MSIIQRIHIYIKHVGEQQFKILLAWRMFDQYRLWAIIWKSIEHFVTKQITSDWAV